MKFITSLALLTCVLPGLAACAEDAARPHIVYFLVDDMGYSDCGFNGGTEVATPHIDKLASQGAVLKSYYVQPLCSPTRAAFLSGRFPTHTGVYHVVTPGAPWGLPLDERTLPQALSEAGYTTAISGKWHLGEFREEYRPHRRGFAHQYGHMMGNLNYFTHIRDDKLDWYRNDKPLHEAGYTTNLIANEAVRVISEQPADKPLFLYVSFNGIHSPYQVPERYKEPYADLPELRGTVAGMMAAVDEAVGQVMWELENQGLLENTLVVFSSDNGGSRPGKATDNRPLRGGKGGVYEGGVRVAACASWPGHIPAGEEIAEPVHIVDWYPTLLKLAGASMEQEHAPDGKDILPVLTEGAKSPHEALLLQGKLPQQKALRMGNWKLVLPKRGVTQLYNLAEDLSEENDLADSQPERVKQMLGRLEELTKDAVPLGGPLPSSN